MSVPALSLESCQSTPSRDITYLEEGYIFPEFRNNSNLDLEILRVVVKFQTENDLPPYETQVSPMLSVKAGNRSQIIRIPFLVDLSLIQNTNSLSILASYKHRGSTQTLSQSYQLAKSLIISPIARQVRFLFLSHKDPEDAPIARKFDHYLRKIGFEGYLAEDDRQPGQDLWQKIRSKIEQSLTLAAFWTRNAESDPAFMKRELEYSISVGKKPVLFAEHGVNVPDSFPKGVEFEEIRMTPTELVEMAESVEGAYRAGLYG